MAKDLLIGDFSQIGLPYRMVEDVPLSTRRTTVVGNRCQIGSYVIVGKGTKIGDATSIESYVNIEQDVTIGRRCHIIYRSQICNDAEIGNDCVIGGFVGERTKIGNRVRMFGSVVHSQWNPTLQWDEAPEEKAARILEGSFVGFGAVVAGGVKVGPRAYVCSNSIVSKDVPADNIVMERNKPVHFKKWKGTLKDSPIFRRVDS